MPWKRSNPTAPSRPSCVAACIVARKDAAAARKNFEEALRRDPRYLSAVVNLAALDVVQNQPDAAKARFDKLLELEPKNVQALLALAELKRRTGGSPTKWPR